MWDLESLKRGLEFLDKIYRNKLNNIVSTEKDFSHIVRPLSKKLAENSIKEYFGSGIYKAVGIDGSMDYSIGLDIVTMFISVASFSLPFEVDNVGSIKISFNNIKKEDSKSVFKIIPFWFDDLSGFTGKSNLLDERAIGRTLDSIPRSVMTLGEYYMGCESLKDRDVKIVFLDRPIASSYSPFFRDARELLKKYGGGIFTVEGVDGKKISLVDLYLSIYFGPYPGFIDYEYRPGYTLHYVIQKILEHIRKYSEPEIDLKELEKYVPSNVSIDKVLTKIKKFDNTFLGGRLVDDVVGNKLILSRDIFGYWDRTMNVVDTFIDKLFSSDESSYSHPLYIDGRPILVKEINTVSLFKIYDLKYTEITLKKLVIGIGKDTSVTDMSRSVLPYLRSKGFQVDISYNVAHSDRNMYSIISSLYRDQFPVPWRSLGYDHIFSTLVFRDDSLTPARKKASISRFLVRNYFQLREVKSLDTYLRSPVFFYDRFYRDDDDKLVVKENIKHIDKPYTSKIFIERVLSPIDNMVLYILKSFDNDQIIESAGHNYLLFMADKEVKRMISTVKNSVSQVVENTMYRLIRTYDIYILTKSFREYRAQFERRRRR